MRRTVLLLLLGLNLGIWAAPAPADEPDDPARRSVVRIISSIRTPDPYHPWSRSSPSEATGSGVVIAGNRILTNAHVVNFAGQVLVQFDRSGDKHTAVPVAVAPGIDLAVLRLEDEAAFAGHPALPVGAKLPAPQQTVLVYGYPEGGVDLSITRGIVSRIEFTQYYLFINGLRVQVDAAINPGNSGGPAVVDGRLVGIVFSKLDRADNIGYIIPMEEINLFLADVADGRYDGKPVLPISTQDLENPALRASLNLDRKTTGVLVRKVDRPDPGFPIRVDDVLTRLGDSPIDNTGMVRVEGDRHLKFRYLVQHLCREGKLPVTVVRAGRSMDLSVPVDSDQRWLVRRYYEGPVPYFVFGPLVFAEASDKYASEWIGNVSGSDDLLGVAGSGPLFWRAFDRAAEPGERMVIVASPMFSNKLGKGYRDPYGEVVHEVDGVRVRNLPHLVELLRDGKGEFVSFSFQGHWHDKVVFNRKEAIAATEEILSDNGIRQQCSPDLLKIWDLSRSR
ncbi:S1C family serine protease [Aquisphaera giovannonii]|nr:trypsin-like peptidase domain-containing protein [Aquisphaera giovannonii]